MIELRVIDRGFYGMEYQYRYKNQPPSGCIQPLVWEDWSEWKTAPVLKEEEIEND
jgi:hypothetical protein